ncbi:hypothetical protein TIFTF001_016607 [Ficus carica]|uniref:Uncharacterized protein n=1 Tax=Ficus carica TaxID=3494 RepID=A0AA88A0N9_FICCA|nr:hypothetical protein TIFTF001_016607 [Ficus carica]
MGGPCRGRCREARGVGGWVGGGGPGVGGVPGGLGLGPGLEVVSELAKEIAIEGGLDESDGPNSGAILIDVASTRERCQVRLFVAVGIARKTMSRCRNREEIAGKSRLSILFSSALDLRAPCGGFSENPLGYVSSTPKALDYGFWG